VKQIINICSVSGGKDSTALYCLMQEYHGSDFYPIFANTGHEHPVTLNYVRNLAHMTKGPEVATVEANFERQLTVKGYKKTDYTFLDMMLWKGRAPSSKAQFCTEHLKLWPIKFHLEQRFPRDQYEWVMHTGIRAGESARRAKMHPFSYNDFFDCLSVLPMLYNDEGFEFEYLEEKGIPPNPLYALGYGRVGCFPCIHANKDELVLLPDWAWERLEYYESELKRSWFPPRLLPGKPDGYIPSIREVREWCKTTRYSRDGQYNMFRTAPEDAPSCMTGWIACE
jgi:3'-phosphoadenosine 5'-phosphosulfate sulfotransferase (PAPS reductase)/FAD synthetase